MSIFGFGQTADIDIILDGADSRKMADIKTEEGKKERHYVFYDGESVSGKSPDYACSVAFSQRTNNSCLIEDETFNDSDIINNFIDYKVGQELDSLRAISYFMVPKNKSIEIVSSSDERDFELIHHRKISALDYAE